MKKNLFIMILAITLSSCAQKYYESVGVSDFTPYVEKGLYIYPVGTTLSDRYIPLSDVSVTFFIGTESKYSKEKGLTSVPGQDYNMVVPNGKYMVSRLVEEAATHSPDAIINYQLTPLRTLKGQLYGYTATGIAVKFNR